LCLFYSLNAKCIGVSMHDIKNSTLIEFKFQCLNKLGKRSKNTTAYLNYTILFNNGWLNIIIVKV